MASILWAVYLIVAVTVDCRHLKGHNSQNTTIDEQTEDFDIEAVDEIYMIDDMMLTEEQWSAFRQRKAKNDTKYRWSEGPIQPDGNQYPQVRYVFLSNEPSICKSIWCLLGFYKSYCSKLCNSGFKAFPDALKPEVEKAIQHWKDHTCIEFVDITNASESSEQWQKPHLLLDGSPTCSSKVGMLNRTNIPGQRIHMVCPGKTFGSRVHEIGHSLGFYHEQNRSDRDQYIKIFTKNIKKKSQKNFALKKDDNMGIEYDYTSVVQYGAYSGSEDNKVSSVPLDPVNLELLGTRDGLSFRDKHLANKMYNCIAKWERNCKQNKPKTCGEGYTGKNCTCFCPPHKTGLECEKEKPGSNGDYYYEKRNQALNEVITSPMKLTAKVPTKTDIIFVKSIVPPVCKMATVTFTSSNLNPNDCNDEFLHVVTNLTNLEGEPLCHEDLVKGHILTSDKKIIINTIIDSHPDPIKDISLWEAEVTFHDILDCNVPVSPTTTTATTTTTTSLGPDSCSGIFKITSQWAGTVSAWLEITFPKTVSSWNLELTFTKDITDLIIWNMDKEITSDRTVTLTPKPWNAYREAGSVLSVNFQIKFDGSEPSKLISAKLDGDELCK